MRAKILLSIVFLVIVLLIIKSILGISGSGEIKWDYHGKWYSEGFGTYGAWRYFVDLFINHLFELRVVSVEGGIGIKAKNIYGEEIINTDLVKFDENTGKLTYSFNVTMPNGSIKKIFYNISLNGFEDIRKAINPYGYFNKTLEEILKELYKKEIKITLTGYNGSSITLIPNKSHSNKFEISYEKSSNETLIINNRNLNFNNSENLTERNNTNEVREIIGESKNYTNNITNSEKTDFSNKSKLVIINPAPEESRIKMFIGEKKRFSVENSDYDEIKWTINNQIIKKNSKQLDFRASEQGRKTIEIEIKKENSIASRRWIVNIFEGENQKKFGWYLVLRVIFIIISVCTIILIFLKILRKIYKS